MRKQPRVHLCRFTLGLVCTLVVRAGYAQAIYGLGDLPGGSFESTVFGISSDGTAVVGRSHSGAGYQAFRWTQTNGLAGLGFLPGGDHSAAYSASAEGNVVVGFSHATTTPRAFRWTASGGMVNLGTIDPNDSASYAYGVSADGAIVVGSNQHSSLSQAFSWTSTSGMVGLGYLPGTSDSAAFAMTPDGDVIVGSVPTAPYQAFRWEAGTMTPIGDLPGGDAFSNALGVSADGEVVVGYSGSAGGDEAFRWTTTTGMQGLGDLPGSTFTSVAKAANHDGGTIVGYGTTAAGARAFIWDPINGIRRLDEVLIAQGTNLSGWTLQSAEGISADGRVITGNGLHNGNREAWVAILVPEPNSAAILLLGAGLISIRLRQVRCGRSS